MTTESILIGESTSIQKLKRDILRLSKGSAHILIEGQRGTGKTTAAELIHEGTKNRGNLLFVNPCTTTDNEIQKITKALPAETSTIVIQEIEGFSIVNQAQLHDVMLNIPSRPFVRLVVTIKSPLAELVATKRLHDGLAKTLKGFDLVTIPALHERSEDIPLLIEHFINVASERMNIAVKSIDINMLDFLVRRTWKDNIRELRLVIERAVIESEGTSIELPGSLVDEFSQLDGILKNIKGKRTFAFDKSLSNLERTLIERALEAAGSNQSRAAAILNLSEANLRYRLKKFRIKS